MHIPDVHDYDGEPHEEKAQEFLTEQRKKAVKSEIEQIMDDEYYKLEEYAGEYISQLAANRAEEFLERVLKGDEDAAMSLLGSKYDGGRYRGLGADEGRPWAHVIHGRVFESGGMKLRRDIVEAHADLLRDERIKDLESTVEGLRLQVVELERERDERAARMEY